MIIVVFYFSLYGLYRFYEFFGLGNWNFFGFVDGDCFKIFCFYYCVDFIMISGVMFVIYDVGKFNKLFICWIDVGNL